MSSSAPEKPRGQLRRSVGEESLEIFGRLLLFLLPSSSGVLNCTVNTDVSLMVSVDDQSTPLQDGHRRVDLDIGHRED